MTMASRSSGTEGFRRLGGGAALFTCCIATATGVSAVNGGRPVSISYMTQPSE